MSMGARQAADASRIPLVDMASMATGHEMAKDLYDADGIHPSKAGSLLVAHSIADLISELYASR